MRSSGAAQKRLLLETTSLENLFTVVRRLVAANLLVDKRVRSRVRFCRLCSLVQEQASLYLRDVMSLRKEARLATGERWLAATPTRARVSSNSFILVKYEIREEKIIKV